MNKDNINIFRDELKKIYNKYPAFIKVIDELDASSNNYIEFLYYHLNENICLKNNRTF